MSEQIPIKTLRKWASEDGWPTPTDDELLALVEAVEAQNALDVIASSTPAKGWWPAQKRKADAFARFDFGEEAAA